tara:strand:+ start:203 stop:550 length:348 start_codon:yes stop_codon:yes gene_type:complete
MVELWTPWSTKTIIGDTQEVVFHDGVSIVIHTFQFHDPVTDRSQMVKIPADSDVSIAHVEDMAAQALENFIKECRGLGNKKKPTEDQRKEIGKQIEEFRKYRAKRDESTNNKLYY